MICQLFRYVNDDQIALFCMGGMHSIAAFDVPYAVYVLHECFASVLNFALQIS